MTNIQSIEELNFNKKDIALSEKEFIFKGLNEPQTNQNMNVSEPRYLINEMKEHLDREYNLSILLMEMRLYRSRMERMTNRIQRYFNSTPFKNAFSRFMVYAYMVETPYNITTLASEMVADRKTISQTIKECEAEGWVQTRKIGGQLYAMATDILYQQMLTYCAFRKELAKNTTHKCALAIDNFESLMSTNKEQTNGT